MRIISWIQCRSPRSKRVVFYGGGVLVLLALSTPPLRILFDTLPGKVGEKGLAYVKGQSEGVWGAWAIGAYLDLVLRWFRVTADPGRLSLWARRAVYLAVTGGWMLFITWTPWKDFLYDLFGSPGLDIWQFFRTGYEGVLAGALMILVVDFAIFGLRAPVVAEDRPEGIDSGAVTATGLDGPQAVAYVAFAVALVLLGANWSSPASSAFGETTGDFFFFLRRLSESPIAAVTVAVFVDAMLGRSTRAVVRFAPQQPPRRWIVVPVVALMVLFSYGGTSTEIGDALGAVLTASQVDAVQQFLFIQYETWCLVSLVVLYVAFVWARPLMGQTGSDSASHLSDR